MPVTRPLPAPAVDPGSAWGRLVHGRRVVYCEPEWVEFAGPDWAARVMDEAVTDRFHAKQGRTIARWTLERDGRSLVVYLKRHYELPRRHGLLAALRPGRAWSPGLAEWEHLRWAAANGFPVPRAPAVVEFLGPWGRLQSVLAVEELTDGLPLHEAIPLAAGRLPADRFETWKAGLVAELARLSRELHRRKAYHQDLYLCHFYVAAADAETVPEAWAGRVAMIDFHRLTRRRVGSAWWQAKDLGQLLYSTYDVPGIGPRDRDRFWADYRAGDWGDVAPPSGWIGRVARYRADRYYRKNRARAARAGG